MAPLNPRQAFQQLRAERQRHEQACAEAGQRKLEQWTASDRRAATCDRLMNLFASQGAGGVDVSEAAALLVEFAATLPADWVQARVRFVSERLEQLCRRARPRCPAQENPPGPAAAGQRPRAGAGDGDLARSLAR